VRHFIELARAGKYDGLTFHRVIENQLIQGGDPKGDGTGGIGDPIPDEFNNRAHVFGTVGMARTSEPNSARSQFYICLGRKPAWDRRYTVFGQVIDGQEAVRKISKVKTDHHTIGGKCGRDHKDRPLESVYMRKIRILERSQWKREKEKQQKKQQQQEKEDLKGKEDKPNEQKIEKEQEKTGKKAEEKGKKESSRDSGSRQGTK
jgi:cyclophilin family peptidyl-prolyl cis-trans isomerase